MRIGVSVGIVGVLAAVIAAGAALAAPARAGTVFGRLELPPPPERAPVVARGFVDRIENPLADIRKPSLGPYLVVSLENDARSDAAPPQVSWDLVGESFARPVIAVPVGAEVVIKNQTKIARTITAAEDAKLIVGPLNPTGTKSFRATQPAIYTLGDRDAPHLRGKVVVVATPFIATADVNNPGKFDFPDVPEGTYKLRIFYKDNWIDRPDETITVGTKKQEITAKVPAGYPLKK